MNYASIYVQLGELFNKYEAESKGTGYMVLRLVVPTKLLYDLYNKFIADGITPIEQLTVPEKIKYFSIAKGFYDDLVMQIKTAKAAYVLDLITSNN